MGCTASKLDNEDTVRRCKERRRLIKDAVQSRHHLASAHNDYLRSLLTTGSALTRFARGEPISVSQQAPPILLHSSIPSSSLPPPTPQPPPRPPFSPSPSHTIASSKLPHILTDSSTASKKSASPKYPRAVHAHAAYASTPSQASSVWDWENFYPPSPPDSEFFDRIKEEREKEERFQFQNRHQHHLLREEDEEEEEEEEEGEGDRREEVHCSEWGGEQHCGSSTTSSMTKSDDEDEEKYSRSDGFAARSEFGGSEPVSRPAPSEIGSSSMRHSVRKDRSETGSSSGWTARDDSSVAGDLRMVVRHRDLAEIVAALEEYFVKAAGAGEPMSELLETGREQLDRSFRQLKSELF